MLETKLRSSQFFPNNKIVGDLADINQFWQFGLGTHTGKSINMRGRSDVCFQPL